MPSLPELRARIATPPSLQELQARCLRAFLLGEDAGLAPALADGAIPVATQIAVYRNNASETFRRALLATYPVTARLVGDACFAGLAEKYRREHPSASGDLVAYGERFPQLLDELYGGTAHAYLGDVARLELACDEVLVEPACDDIDADRLRRIEGEALGGVAFTVARGVRLVASSYPVLAIWRSQQADEPWPVDVGAGAEHVAVVRRGGDAVLNRLTPGAYGLATLLGRGLPLGTAFESWTLRHDDGAFGPALETLLSIGLFSDFSIHESER